MGKVNKNLSHNGADYKKGDIVKDAAAAAELIKLGHADPVEAEAKAPKKSAAKAEVEAPAEDVVEESFDDIDDGPSDAPPAPDKPKKSAGKKAAKK